MELILIRHGEPDYTPCAQRGWIGHGRDLAPLTETGILQAEQVSKNPILQGSEGILSSPYTRALQTAAVISKNTGLPISIEVDLHEWLPDKGFQFKTAQEAAEAYEDFCRSKGVPPEGTQPKWETKAEMERRLARVLEKYKAVEKLILVAHGEVIRRLTGRMVQYCEAIPVAVTDSFRFADWADMI